MLPNRDHDDRPWGSFDRFTLNESSTVKLLRLLPGKRISLQKHAGRAEFWRITAGSGTASVDGVDRAVAAGDEVEIPVGATHRLAAGPDGLDWLEIALGDFDENDNTRLQDDFGREGAAPRTA